jgi:hypothetical protein
MTPRTAPSSGRKTGRGLASVAAVVLAFAASQHHNMHMLAIALGAGGAGSTFMQGYPLLRRLMLLASAGVVAMNLLSLRRTSASSSVRWWVLSVSVLTVGIIIWSLARFGI